MRSYRIQVLLFYKSLGFVISCLIGVAVISYKGLGFVVSCFLSFGIFFSDFKIINFPTFSFASKVKGISKRYKVYWARRIFQRNTPSIVVYFRLIVKALIVKSLTGSYGTMCLHFSFIKFIKGYSVKTQGYLLVYYDKFQVRQLPKMFQSLLNHKLLVYLT